MMPLAGGQYVYLREAYSPLWGFLYGWTSFIVIQTGTIAAVGVAFAKFLGVLVPVLGTGSDAIIYHGGSFAGFPLQLPWLAEPIPLFAFKEFTISNGQLVGVATVFLLTWWNTLGIQQGKILQKFSRSPRSARSFRDRHCLVDYVQDGGLVGELDRPVGRNQDHGALRGDQPARRGQP